MVRGRVSLQEVGRRQAEDVSEPRDHVGDQLVAVPRHGDVVDRRALERVGALGRVEVARLVVLVDGDRLRDHLDVAAPPVVGGRRPAVVVVHALARLRVDDRLDRVAVGADRRPTPIAKRHQSRCHRVDSVPFTHTHTPV